jgi:hypothetical protein
MESLFPAEIDLEAFDAKFKKLFPGIAEAYGGTVEMSYEFSLREVSE